MKRKKDDINELFSGLDNSLDDGNSLLSKDIIKLYGLAFYLHQQGESDNMLVEAVETAIKHKSRNIYHYLGLLADEYRQDNKSQYIGFLRKKIQFHVNEFKKAKTVKIKPADKELLKKHKELVAAELRRLIEMKLPRGLRELSEKTGLTEAAISRIVHGQNTPRENTLDLIIGVLGITSVSIVAGD